MAAHSSSIEPTAPDGTPGPSSNSGEGAGGYLNWYALHVHSNYETIVSRALKNRCIPSFCPTYKKKASPFARFAKGGKVDSPVLPGYVFFQADLTGMEVRVRLLRIPGVVKILYTNCDPAPIPFGEIDSLRKLVESGAMLGPSLPLSFHRGETVEIADGPLRGVRAVVERSKPGLVTVLMETLGRQVSTKVPLKWLKKTKPATLKRAA